MDELDFGATLRGFAPGQKVFNRYTLRQILGRGGMGVVWLARDEELERDIALKFLPEIVAADREAIAELKRETRRNLELTHPHIVRIYDFVQDARTAGIAMEYVSGNTLAARKLDHPQGRFEVTEIAGWTRQLLAALDYAHTQNQIVHRDLKPANLMVDGKGNLKITDFGIAASVSDSVSRVSVQAGTSGTPVYMSPQQMMGERPAVTDDLYAVGATLFELLTGKPPFYSGNVLLQVQSKVPPTVAARREVLGKAGEPVPAAWEEAIAGCLAKDPADRPQSAAELSRRLEGAAAPRPAAVPSAPAVAPVPVAAVAPAGSTAFPSGAITVAAATSAVALAVLGLWLMKNWYYDGEHWRQTSYLALVAWVGGSVALAGWAVRGALQGSDWLQLVAGNLFFAVPYLEVGRLFLNGEEDDPRVLLFRAAGPPALGLAAGAVSWLALRGPLGLKGPALLRHAFLGLGFGLVAWLGTYAWELPERLRWINSGMEPGYLLWIALGVVYWLQLLRVMVLAGRSGKTEPRPQALTFHWLAIAAALLAVAFYGLQQFWRLGAVYEADWESMARLVESAVAGVVVAGIAGIAPLLVRPRSSWLSWLGHGLVLVVAMVAYREFRQPVEMDDAGELVTSAVGLYGPPLLGLLAALSGLVCFHRQRPVTVRGAAADLLAGLVAGLVGTGMGLATISDVSLETTLSAPVWFALLSTLGLSLLWLGLFSLRPAAARPVTAG